MIKNVYNNSTTSSLGAGDISGYLEICGLSDPSQWTPACGGTLWTDREALVACNTLGYPNKTTIGMNIKSNKLNDFFNCSLAAAINGGLCSAAPGSVRSGVKIVECSG